MCRYSTLHGKTVQESVGKQETHHKNQGPGLSGMRAQHVALWQRNMDPVRKARKSSTCLPHALPQAAAWGNVGGSHDQRGCPGANWFNKHEGSSAAEAPSLARASV